MQLQFNKRISTMTGRVALVTGANGISGNAIIEALIRRPKEEWQVNDNLTQ